MKKIILLFLTFCMFFLTACGGEKPQNDDLVETFLEETPSVSQEELAQTEFYNKMQTDERPVAVMIDNDSKEARPQIGLESAYMVYEIIVEGGATRFMALFKGDTLPKVGPVRSARHYFLDYALEHDAIYVHSGWSPQASRDISRLGVNNINGILGVDGQIFWRDKTYDKTWHNLYTGIDKIRDMAVSTKKYKDKTSVKHLGYCEKDMDIESEKPANKISLPYSTMYRVNYEYDAGRKLYKRFVDGKEHMSQTGEVISVKNIIIYKVANYTLNDGEDKGRQELKNIGSGSGYYVTNGKAIDIKWSKSSRGAKTVYTKADGSPLLINPGNTYIQIVPMESEIGLE